MLRRYLLVLLLYFLPLVPTQAQQAAHYDLIIRGGWVYDGSAEPPRQTDVAVQGDRIVHIGSLDQAKATLELDARGLAVAPGFINMLSWATESLIVDGRSLSDIRQGVTLEVFGEGWSMGPLNDALKKQLKQDQDTFQYAIEWTTLGEYLDFLAARGVATNIASFVGATTVRQHELGDANRAPSPAELERMQALVAQAMEEGALGLGSSLIYAPAFYADTEELVALASVAARYDGLYISHLRSEGNGLMAALEELIGIAQKADIAAEIYHLKAAGQDNWPKMAQVLERIEAARGQGLAISANMYTYTAGATGLDAAMPPWVQEGGLSAWIERLKDPEIRRQLVKEMRQPSDQWENLLLAAGSAESVLLSGFRNPQLQPLAGRTLAAVASERGTSVEQTAMDLVIEDNSRVGTIYFLMSEHNLKQQMQRPWVSFGSDAASLAPQGKVLASRPHPRAYGNFARLLGSYVREQHVITLSQAIHRLTALPAGHLKLRQRGRLMVDYFADIVVFDPTNIRDHATYAKPHRLATGVEHVVVNGQLVLRHQRHTGATPGRVLRGPGWRGFK